MLLGVCHVHERLCGGSVYLGRYNKCLIFIFTFTRRSEEEEIPQQVVTQTDLQEVR